MDPLRPKAMSYWSLLVDKDRTAFWLKPAVKIEPTIFMQGNRVNQTSGDFWGIIAEKSVIMRFYCTSFKEYRTAIQRAILGPQRVQCAQLCSKEKMSFTPSSCKHNAVNQYAGCRIILHSSKSHTLRLKGDNQHAALALMELRFYKSHQ